jgi:hypothetical protein
MSAATRWRRAYEAIVGQVKKLADAYRRAHKVDPAGFRSNTNIVHRVGVRAEGRVEHELMKYAREVLGKARLLYQLAKAAKRDTIGGVWVDCSKAVSRQTLVIYWPQRRRDEKFPTSVPANPTAPLALL